MISFRAVQGMEENTCMMVHHCACESVDLLKARNMAKLPAFPFYILLSFFFSPLFDFITLMSGVYG